MSEPVLNPSDPDSVTASMQTHKGGGDRSARRASRDRAAPEVPLFDELEIF